MALIADAKIYGFGSHFHGGESPRDLDLLVLHRDVSAKSVAFAIELKSVLCAVIPNADVVMLSEQEERDFAFIARARALPIGEVTRDPLQRNIPELSGIIWHILCWPGKDSPSRGR
jgi:hypothetical protein